MIDMFVTEKEMFLPTDYSPKLQLRGGVFDRGGEKGAADKCHPKEEGGEVPERGRLGPKLGSLFPSYRALTVSITVLTREFARFFVLHVLALPLRPSAVLPQTLRPPQVLYTTITTSAPPPNNRRLALYLQTETLAQHGSSTRCILFKGRRALGPLH